MSATPENENIRIGPNPNIEGRDRPQVEPVERRENDLSAAGVAEQGINRHIAEERTRTIPPEEVAMHQAQISANVKRTIAQATQKAEAVRDQSKLSQQVPQDLLIDATDVSRSVNVFLHAVEHDLIVPPQHEPTRKVFDAFVEKLILTGEPSVRNAAYYQIIINGLLHEQSYVQFSNSESAETKFEKDLVEILNNPSLNNFMKDVIRMAYARGENAIPGMTNIQAQQRIDQLREESHGNVKATIEGLKKENRDNIGRQEHEYLESELSKDVDSAEGREALELFHELEDKGRFYEYYKKRYEERLRTILRNPDQRGIQLEKAQERAAKDTTEAIHRGLMYMMYKIYSPILSDKEEKSFQERIQSFQGLYGVSPNMLFNWLKRRIMKINASIDQSSSASELNDLHFYQYGNEEVESYVQFDDPNDGYVKKGRLIKDTTISSELKKCEGGFYEFVENMHLSMDAENDLLTAGINFNHLMLTGKLDQEQQTFFRQAAAYAQAYLPSSRIDELYKLPYNEVVEAAKISISNYYKKRFSYNEWIRDPTLVQGIFQSRDPIHHEALKDMIENFRNRVPPVPDWVIRRGFIHARTHLSLLNLEMHALASYAHAPVTMLKGTTYKDPAFKNLETFRTWYAHEQWGVSDTSLKDMAFLPSPSASWRYNRWIHEDVSAEGKEIYEESVHIGKLSRVEREYFDWDIAPNIMELNPMKFGGVEIQRNFRLKYPMLPWLGNLVDQEVDNERLKLQNTSDITEGWKRLENIGVNVLREYRDSFLFGKGNKFLEFSADGSLKYEAHLKDYFMFLYRRYFAQGVGHDAMSMTVFDANYNKTKINYSDIASAEQFYARVVEPILKAEILKGGKGDSDKDAKVRNLADRAGQLKSLVSQALTVAAFERMPLDFVYVENPSRSQNGITLIRELKNTFITSADKDESTRQFQDFDNALDDIAYVQQYAREESIKQMNEFIRAQNDDGSESKNVFSRSSREINDRNHDTSDIYLAGQRTGYVIDQGVVRRALEQRHGVGNPRVALAVQVYEEIAKKVVLKPGKNKQEVNPEISDTRLKHQMRIKGLRYENVGKREQFKQSYGRELKQKYAEIRENTMETRLAWSGEELLSGETVFSMNDTAYQFLEFIRAGRDMPQRTINAIAVTQEKYKSWMTDPEGALLSALKKYYRKEDLEELHKGIVEMRTRIKEEDVDQADRMAYEVLLNAINVMRINSDAENSIGESQYNAIGRKRSAFSGVVKEGDAFPLRREDRYKIITEFLHSAQFTKYSKGANVKFETEKSWTFEKVLGNLGSFGEDVGRAADMMFGRKAGKLVRKKFDDISGEGMRSRELAGILDLVKNNAIPTLLLIAVAFFILFTIQGYKASEEG